MKQSTNFDLDIVVHGSSVRKFFHDGRFYVEGKEGSEFSVKVKNNTGKRVLAVMTVDGLSVIDGKDGSFDSQGYILEAWSSTVIPGWRISDKEVARFEFTDGKSSYAGSKGKARNIGVIGCAFYYEKEWTYTSPNFGTSTMTVTNTGGSYNLNTNSMAEEINLGGSSNTVLAFLSQVRSTPTASSLGTAFGDKTGHKVVKSSFQRATDQPAEVLTVYYDSRKGLESRGIDLDRTTEIASAFPKENGYEGYCQPPTNWRG